MTPITKFSLAILLGASITACSEQPESTTTQAAEVASTEKSAAPAEKEVKDSHDVMHIMNQ